MASNPNMLTVTVFHSLLLMRAETLSFTVHASNLLPWMLVQRHTSFQRTHTRLTLTTGWFQDQVTFQIQSMLCNVHPCQHETSLQNMCDCVHV
jgi:hypothetical protein